MLGGNAARMLSAVIKGDGMGLMISRAKLAVTIAMCLLIVQTARAKEDGLPGVAPKIFKEVVDCRAIAEATARLACYDSTVAKLDEAQKKNEVFIADKEQVRETRKGLFGLSLPKIKIFGNSDEIDEIKEVNAVIASVRNGQRGFIFELEDGAVWAQTDKQFLGRTPKAGQKIFIRKAALGSYIAKVENGGGFRVERLNN